MEYTLTDKQSKAIKLAKEWWNNESLKIIKPFVLAGIAGSGKTFTISTLIKELNLESDNVAYVAYTGMAASVLTRKGNPATTIHKLIYDPIVNEDTNEVHFILKENLNANLRLIIIDEVSMVSDDLLKDVMSFNIPIIACGDPEQLPPVQSSMNSLLSNPDIFLDEPLRQALDNPIIYLANKARKNEFIKYGTYGDNAIVIPKTDITLNMYKQADQIIACKNNTVNSLNKFYRRIIKGITDSKLPINGEKLICLRNNWDRVIYENNIEQFLTNGLIGYCSEIKNPNSKIETFDMTFKPSYFNENVFAKVLTDAVYFTDGIKDDKELYGQYDKYGELLYHRKLYQEEKLVKINKFTFGYAITCHKSQGSEYNNVLFIAEFYNREIYPKSLYTGITRAKEKLILVK